MYTYFTKYDIEAKLSKIELCGSVVVDLKKYDNRVLVKYGNDGVFEKTSADEIARKITSNDKACAIVDCDEGMMVFKSSKDRDEHGGF